MTKRKPDPDANEDAARVLRELAGEPDTMPAGLELAWADWSRRIKDADKRTMTLLRAAFEAGAEAGSRHAASAAGKRAGLKGGAARKLALTPKRRAEIAKIAADKRWGSRPA